MVGWDTRRLKTSDWQGNRRRMCLWLLVLVERFQASLLGSSSVSDLLTWAPGGNSDRTKAPTLPSCVTAISSLSAYFCNSNCVLSPSMTVVSVMAIGKASSSLSKLAFQQPFWTQPRTAPRTASATFPGQAECTSDAYHVWTLSLEEWWSVHRVRTFLYVYLSPH